jgi:hypothetical protein
MSMSAATQKQQMENKNIKIILQVFVAVGLAVVGPAVGTGDDVGEPGA